jgi:16S rRNA (cytosine967-C5)-methyltransferase
LRLYRNLIDPTVKALQEIFEQGNLADRVVQPLLKSNRKWGSKDRRFIASNVYDVVRWYRLYYETLGETPKSTVGWWRLLGTKWIIEGHELPKWEEFAPLDPALILQKYEAAKAVRKVKHAIPDWMDDLGSAALGDDWEAFLTASNEPAEVVLRVNLLKTSLERLQTSLVEQGIETRTTDLKDALIVNKRAKVTHTKAFKSGWFELQDASSQLVASYLDVKPDTTVIDACAGAGGKSLHLATLMENKGKLIALDIYQNKLKELERRARRAGVSVIEAKLIRNEKMIERHKEKADYLLMDVPCSGLGTLRRNPNIKWHLTPKFIEQIKATQQSILQSYTSMVKPGGLAVYATCSVLPEENELQIEAFLESEAGQNFKLVKSQSVLPQLSGFDGFYMALLQKD